MINRLRRRANAGSLVSGERDFREGKVGFRHQQVGLGQGKVSAGLGQLIIHVRSADLGDKVPLGYAVADVHQPTLQVAGGTGVERSLAKGLSVARQDVRGGRGCGPGSYY